MEGQLKCHRCPECNGYGCPDMLPGLGGVMGGVNFQANYESWKELENEAGAEGVALDSVEVLPSMLRCGPVTGAVENIGFANEEDFYYPYLKNAYDAGFGLCIGDGCPDEKLKFGIAAVERLEQEAGVAGAGGGASSSDAPLDAAFFLKPYPQERLFERIEWIGRHARYIGIDIDSYNILTMRNLVNLERKTTAQLEEFRKVSGVPFVIKGIFTDADLELVKEVHPDVVYISNHGGRVETRQGSTGDFLKAHAAELKKHCDQLWVDGGIRTMRDIQTALYYGADQVIMARPLIRATFDGTYDSVISSCTSKNTLS